MKKLRYHGNEYRILQPNEETLLKLSTLPPEVWQNFIEKDLPNANTPIACRKTEPSDFDIFGGYKSPLMQYRSVITLPFLSGYQSLLDNTFPVASTTKDILKIFRNNLEILRQIHEKGVCHGDITSSNIMINKENNLEFIDFDSCIIDDYISDENTTIRKEKSKKEIFDQAIREDKEALLFLYITYLAKGNFIPTFHVSYKDLNFTPTAKRLFQEIFKNKDLPRDCYYDDFIEHLISTNYESPKVYSKNILSKYGF